MMENKKAQTFRIKVDGMHVTKELISALLVEYFSKLPYSGIVSVEEVGDDEVD